MRLGAWDAWDAWWSLNRLEFHEPAAVLGLDDAQAADYGILIDRDAVHSLGEPGRLTPNLNAPPGSHGDRACGMPDNYHAG